MYYFNNSLNTIIAENIPIQENKKTEFPAWFNKDLIGLIISKKTVHCRWKSTDDYNDRIEFKAQSQMC